MKVEDSGMPEESYWNSLFDIPSIIKWLEIKSIIGPIVEIGCGYGTFTVPIAKETNNVIYSFDIERSMIDTAQNNLNQAGLQNVKLLLRDVIDQGTGIGSKSVGLVLLFNILHFNERRNMLEEACRILMQSGRIAIIHWRKDIETPRGPRVDLRPDQQIILNSIVGLDLYFNGNSRILEPYHWGMQLIKGANN